MAETKMPTAEAEAVVSADDERAHYELAFHVLPTVVEGEVSAVFDELKKAVTDAGGTLTDEETPQRFELAYEIEKYIEGKNRKFASAYFGWVRFTAEPHAATVIAAAIEGQAEIMRHLLIRLTREEEAHPFRFHEALASERQVTTVEDREVETPQVETPAAEGNVDETKLDEALKREEA